MRSDYPSRPDAPITADLIAKLAIMMGIATFNGYPMCTHGHVIAETNVIVERGRDRCRECKRDRDNRYRRERRAREAALRVIR